MDIGELTFRHRAEFADFHADTALDAFRLVDDMLFLHFAGDGVGRALLGAEGAAFALVGDEELQEVLKTSREDCF